MLWPIIIMFVTGLTFFCVVGPSCGNDGDKDGVAIPFDNCPSISNPDQADQDGDRIGDACDEKVNQATQVDADQKMFDSAWELMDDGLAYPRLWPERDRNEYYCSIPTTWVE
jgi:hypothetical protein